ncbi:four helix bundle protein [Puniceicoccaceae bacterium K14]|nr:four helix bundle protein [Puniceicoccaceae bacterium K14]
MSGSQPQIKERSFDFSIRIVKLCQSLENDSRISQTLATQLLRSGTSIGANVEEANGSQSKADFTAKMYIACKEARETNYWLRLLVATELVAENKLAPLVDESNHIVAILTAITKTSRTNR